MSIYRDTTKNPYFLLPSGRCICYYMVVRNDSVLDEVIMKLYLICSVRNTTKRQRHLLDDYVKMLESIGFSVYYPPRDCDQTLDGVLICQKHQQAMQACDAVCVYWDYKSIGSHVDLGMAWGMQKKVYMANSQNYAQNSDKNYTQVLLRTSIGLPYSSKAICLAAYSR